MKGAIQFHLQKVTQLYKCTIKSYAQLLRCTLYAVHQKAYTVVKAAHTMKLTPGFPLRVKIICQ